MDHTALERPRSDARKPLEGGRRACESADLEAAYNVLLRDAPPWVAEGTGKVDPG